MTLFLTEKEVLDLLPMERAIDLIESSFPMQHEGRAINRSRERILLDHTSLHYMAAALKEEDLFGMKIYTVTPAGARFVVLIFSALDGGVLAMIEADQLGRIRTGAASGVATKYMARQSASQVGVIGAGRQARTQLEAVSSVRRISSARVFCRDENRRREFCTVMQERLKFPVEPADGAEAVVRFGEILIAATTAREPVLQGEWLKPGSHINAIGSNMPNRREMDNAALARAGTITVDSIAQAQQEAGDLIQGLAGSGRGWKGVRELHEVIAGDLAPRRSDDEITIFKSCGIAIWDVMVAGYIYREALKKGSGRKV